MEDSYNSNCLLCGARLVYAAESQDLECSICHKHVVDNVVCKEGHYVCNECHAQEGLVIIRAVCGQTAERDPIRLAQELMQHQAIHLHGPEHHVLVGAALLAAYHNNGGQIDMQVALPEMVRRGRQIPGGACGSCGCCGAAVSTGIFISIVTGATPLSKREWGQANLMTAAALAAIGRLGGPRCCKRDSFTAILAAVKFVQEQFGVSMPCRPPVCGFSALNEQCLGCHCPYNRHSIIKTKDVLQ